MVVMDLIACGFNKICNYSKIRTYECDDTNNDPPMVNKNTYEMHYWVKEVHVY